VLFGTQICGFSTRNVLTGEPNTNNILVGSYIIGGMSMNEIVKYDNTLNTMQFKDFTAMDYNILMCLCHKVRDKGQEVLTFPFDELKVLTEFGNHSDQLFADELERMIGKLIKVTASHSEGGKKSYFVLFPTFTTDVNKRTLTVRVNKDFSYILNELTDNFTRFELKEFAELDSKYTKTLYRILKQYRYSGWWKPTVDEFRYVMDIPNSFDNKKVMSKVIKPTLNVLAEKFTDLKCEPIKAKKKGAPIERYHFTWQAEKQIKGQMNIADYPGTLPGEEQPKKKSKKNNHNNFEQSPSTPKTKEEWKTFEEQIIDN